MGGSYFESSKLVCRRIARKEGARVRPATAHAAAKHYFARLRANVPVDVGAAFRRWQSHGRLRTVLKPLPEGEKRSPPLLNDAKRAVLTVPASQRSLVSSNRRGAPPSFRPRSSRRPGEYAGSPLDCRAIAACLQRLVGDGADNATLREELRLAQARTAALEARLAELTAQQVGPQGAA